MTQLILMLAIAVGMALFREPLGRALVRSVRAVDWKWAVILALLTSTLWGVLQHTQTPMVGPIAGDGLVALFDTLAYADLLIGIGMAALNQQTRRALGRFVDVVSVVVRQVLRRVRRRARTPGGPRRRPPDRDEPEPVVWGGIWVAA